MGNLFSDLASFARDLWPGLVRGLTGGALAAIMALLALFWKVPGWAAYLFISATFFAAAFGAYCRSGGRKSWSEKLLTISDKFYTNESVEIDGRLFVRCTFDHVKFVFRGTGPTNFVNCKFPSPPLFATDNKAGMVVLSMVAGIKAMSGGKEPFFAEMDSDGKMTPLPMPTETRPLEKKDDLS